jgi:pimeloyl-ACP methyl ester carboxylesterase
MYSPNSTSPSQKLGTILMNPGGPGGPGVEFVKIAGERISRNQLKDSYHLLGFDPRGIGKSQPVVCFGSPAARAVYETEGPIWGVPGVTTPARLPPKREGEKGVLSPVVFRYAERFKGHVEGCQTYSKEFLKGIVTSLTARDMDAIREALGEEKLNYLGYSYGTFLGATYMNMFPDKVGRMILDGVMSPVYAVMNSLVSGVSAYRRIDEIMQHFGEKCEDVGEERCALASKHLAGLLRMKAEKQREALGVNTITAKVGGGDRYIYPAILQLIKDVVLKPISVPPSNSTVPGVITAVDLKEVFFRHTYRPLAWPKLAGALADLFRGNSTTFYMSYMVPSFANVKELCDNTIPDFSSGTNAYHAVTCHDFDDQTHYTLDEWEAQAFELEANTTYIYGRVAHYNALMCNLWDSRPYERYTGPFDVAGLSNKVLLIGNYRDPVTPIEEAEQLESLLGKGEGSVLLRHNAYGHCSGSEPSKCVDKIVTSYMLENKLPERGTWCEPDEEIFPPKKDEKEVRLMSEEDALRGEDMGVIADALFVAQWRKM